MNRAHEPGGAQEFLTEADGYGKLFVAVGLTYSKFEAKQRSLDLQEK